MENKELKHNTIFSLTELRKNELGRNYRVLLKDGMEQICPHQFQPGNNKKGEVVWIAPPCMDVCPFMTLESIKTGEKPEDLAPGIKFKCGKMIVYGIFEERKAAKTVKLEVKNK